MKLKTFLGLLVGIAGLLAAIFIPIPGLGLPAQITLGIFILAAVFWIMEPIPIYATSMMVIFLQIMLLSSQGFIFSVRTAPLAEVSVNETGALLVPAESLGEDGSLYLNKSNKALQVVRPSEVVDLGDGTLAVRGEGLNENSLVIADPEHRSITAGATSYTAFYHTLASPIIMLFLGGFALAAAAVKFGLDRSLTRVLLKPFGKRPAMVCLGLMLCTATLSAFMSNTATTAMMMTVVLPIVASISSTDPFRKCVALAIPVAANIGGIATPIGTPPNAVALAALKESGINISFSTWMVMAVPFTIVLLVFAWWVLLALFKPQANTLEIKLAGSFDKSAKAIASYVIFAVTVLLWVTEKLHGISTTMIAFLPVAILPALGVLDKKDIRGFSWEVLWLVGGGISLGLSLKETGLAAWLIGLVSWNSLGALGVIVVFGVVGYLIANLISHTVSATMIMPLAITVGAALAAAGDFNLVASIVSITAIISIAMVLPISTPPNAIAMATGIIETKDMAKVGVIVGVAGVLLAIVCGIAYWPLIVS
ncbi:SLC13 family permease [Pelagicoccus mobilis]|uniref:DASS family sodium-coupled anion symporter n=1 Tax=Pelagicoccus mobilis TaxID=415221 RepID=A0A934RTJ7_9BACT|nr:DASS family sodium-coupled anion symporter [Pelagicoccus mobilis]MBK1876178.1 DASS family sodium-coupled anion symporter [Pelagicoccus mobilis]